MVGDSKIMTERSGTETRLVELLGVLSLATDLSVTGLLALSVS
jgi:hypothetical protein